MMDRITQTLTVFFVTGFFFLRSQDLHFSQFNENPALVNPALAGANGYVRASTVYKNQWRSVTSPYKTMGASVDMRTTGKRKRAGKFGYARDREQGLLGGGLAVYRDRAGDGLLGLTQLNLTISTFVPTGKRSFLSVGLQGAYVQRKLEYSNYVFPNQYNGLGYDSNMDSRELLDAHSFRYIDVAGGLLWSFGQDERTFVSHREIKGKIGASAYHVTQPPQNFIDPSKASLLMKYVAHGDVLISLNDFMAIAPSFIYQMQGQSTELIAGALYKYYTTGDTKYTGFVKRTTLGMGAYYRNNDALILLFLLEFKENYAIGLSYDIQTSNLSGASRRRGGLELTLRYRSANSFLYQRR